MAKMYGALSERISKIVEELVQQPEGWSNEEIANAINGALRNEAFEATLKTTKFQIVAKRRLLPHTVIPVPVNRVLCGKRPLPTVTIGIATESSAYKRVWTSSLNALVERYYTMSYSLRPLAAQEALEELYAEVHKQNPAITKQAIRMHANSTLGLSRWGMSTDALSAARCADIELVLKRTNLSMSHNELLNLVLERFSESRDLLSIEGLKKIIRDNGIVLPKEVKVAKVAKKTISEEESAFLQFAQLWNDQHVATSDDLIRLVGALWNKPELKWKKIRDYAKRYAEYRHARLEENPEYNVLKPIIIRKKIDGIFIPLPQEILDHLEEYSLDRSLLKSAKGVVVTAAQWGAPLNREYWASLKQYAQFMGYVLVVMPMKYGAIKAVNGKLRTFLPAELSGHMIWDDVLLAQGQLRLNVARFRPTLERYLTDSVCNMGGISSQVFGGTRLELDHRSRIGHRYPKAIMTTGAVTRPNYKVDALGQQDRTGEVATENHEFAAIVFEFPTSIKEEFHFRQLLADKNGEFFDIDVKEGGARRFTKNGPQPAVEGVEGIVLGDWHTNTTCPQVRRTTFEGKHSIVSVLKPKHVVVHDFMDNEAANGYRSKQGVRSAYLAQFGRDNVEGELLENVNEIKWIQSQVPEQTKIHWVPSNHPDLWLTEWVDSGKWVQDHLNRVIGSRLFTMMYEDLAQRAKKEKLSQGKLRVLSPIRLYMNEKVPDLHVIDRQETFTLPQGRSGKKILLSLHGDLGPGGAPSRGTIPFLKYNHDLILGHNHTAIKYRGLWRVGTSTTLMKHYVEGPATSWTNTHAVIFSNGQVMLIHIVNQRYHGQNVEQPKKKNKKK